jgi:hypothetical protein
MSDLLQISRSELDRILRGVVATTVAETLGSLGQIPARVSKSKAANILGSRTILEKFIANGDIKPYKPFTKGKKGNEEKGKTSTVMFDYARLIELKNLDRQIYYG